jgi:hypothetical protein
VDHDALFKMLLKTPTVLQAFFEVFLPDAAKFVDFGALEFVDKELFTRGRKKRTGDLLVKTRFRGKRAGFLIHLEHQAQRDPSLRRRMLEYFTLDWIEYDLPVYPIAVLTGRGTAPVRLSPLAVDFPNKKVLHFDFDVIDLRHMNAEAYVRMLNPAALALAARMRVRREERYSLIKDFTLSLARMAKARPVTDMVASFFFSYRRPDQAEDLKLRQEIARVEPKEMRDRIMQLTNPWIEAGKQEGLQKGLHEGLQKGRHTGEAELVLRLLARRLGALSVAQQKSVRKLPLSKIEELGEALLDFRSRGDLARWLRANQ